MLHATRLLPLSGSEDHIESFARLRLQ
jgi:hypothetical protein